MSWNLAVYAYFVFFYFRRGLSCFKYSEGKSNHTKLRQERVSRDKRAEMDGRGERVYVKVHREDKDCFRAVGGRYGHGVPPFHLSDPDRHDRGVYHDSDYTLLYTQDQAQSLMAVDKSFYWRSWYWSACAVRDDLGTDAEIAGHLCSIHEKSAFAHFELDVDASLLVRKHAQATVASFSFANPNPGLHECKVKDRSYVCFLLFDFNFHGRACGKCVLWHSRRKTRTKPVPPVCAAPGHTPSDVQGSSPQGPRASAAHTRHHTTAARAYIKYILAIPRARCRRGTKNFCQCALQFRHSMPECVLYACSA